MADVMITRLPDNVVQVVASTGTIVTRGSVAALAADPASPYEGQVWFNTTDDALRYHDGTGTVTVPVADTLDGQPGSHYLDRDNHTGAQAIATITGLQAALDAKASTSSLTAGLAGKAGLGHGHTAGDVSNFNTSVDARITKAKIDSLGVDADTLDGVDSTGFATAAQGALADSASQPGHDHDADYDPLGTGATEAASAVGTHEAAGDPHAGYQLESQKGAANGYAALGAGGLVPPAQLGTGTADDTVYLRGDGTFAEPPGAGGGVTDHGSLTGLTDPGDHTQYLLVDGTRALTGDLSFGDSQINDAFISGGAAAAADNQIQFRADTAATWASTDPVLAINEFGVESDTRKFKIGDGVSAWTALGYSVGTFDDSFQGGWESGTDYTVGDSVRHSGDLYVATGDPAIGETPGVAAAWTLLVDAGSALLDRSNHTGTQPSSSISDFSTATNSAVDARVDKPFVDALTVDAGTVEGADAAALRDRATHTGSQTAASISDFSPQVQALIDAAVGALIDGAPAALDTLNELAAAIGDDPNYAATVTAALAAKFDAASHTKATHDALDINAGQVDGFNAADLLDRDNHTNTQAISTVAGLQAALDGKATAAQGATADTAVQVVEHGADATVTRPAGAELVVWQGSVRPDNGLVNVDQWNRNGRLGPLNDPHNSAPPTADVPSYPTLLATGDPGRWRGIAPIAQAFQWLRDGAPIDPPPANSSPPTVELDE